MTPRTPALIESETHERIRACTSLVAIVRWSIPSFAVLTLPFSILLHPLVFKRLGLPNFISQMPSSAWIVGISLLAGVTLCTSWVALMRCIDFPRPNFSTTLLTLGNTLAFFASIMVLLAWFLYAVTRLLAWLL